MIDFAVGRAKEFPGRLVLVRDVPAEYWAKHQSAYTCGRLVGEGQTLTEKWASLKNILGPMDGRCEGSTARDSHDPTHVVVWIPERYFQPVFNAWGEVAP